MKPTREEITSAWVKAIMEVIDRHAEADDAHALFAVETAMKYGRHLTSCDALACPSARCDCGLEHAMAVLSGNSTEDLSTVDEVVAIMAEARLGDDVERFNQDQRIRRAAYEEGARAHGGEEFTEGSTAFEFWLRSAREAAARRYPLKRRVPRVIPERIRALAALLDNPWTLEDDTSVEGAEP